MLDDRLEQVDGQRIDPATYDGIIDAVAERSVTLLHFACHGLSDKNQIKQKAGPIG